MGLRYTFRHLFYGGEIHKERLYKVLEDLDNANGGDEQDIGTLKEDVATLKTGKANSTHSHTVSDVSDVTTVTVVVTYTDESTETINLVKQVSQSP